MAPAQPVPAVDVVIPLFNAARYIERTLRSVLAQTHPPAQVLVVDDGSTDDSVAVVRHFIAAYEGPVQMHLLQQANAGPNAARNRGVQVGGSPFIAFLDADDLWAPTKLERQLAVFTQDGGDDLLLVYCFAHWIDAEDRRLPKAPLREAKPLRGHVFDRLLPRNVVSGGSSAVLIRRSAFERVGPFDEHIRAAEDFDMWLRIARVGRIDLATEDLAAIRLHGHNTTKDTLHMLSGLLDFHAKWFPEAEQRPDVLHEWGHLIALFAARAKDRAAAIELVHRKLDAHQRRAFFRRAGGSLRLYMLLKRLRALFGPKDELA